MADNCARHYEDVAVIGVSGRFPGAASLAEFWRNIREGVESITFFSRDQLRAAGVSDALLANPAYVPAKGYLKDWDKFDAAFFGYSPREAALMDPQIHLLHECAWEALEDAGYAPAGAGNVGVYIGGSSNPFWFCETQRRQATPSERYQALALNDNQSFSTRISYKFGLTGPSYTLQTACSSSLVALHVACRALIARECQMALAGGVSILFPPASGYLHESGMVTSPDGHCRAFDANGRGTLAGDGCGLVVLKLLQHALADGDHVYAIVKGTAINNDGRAKLGYTAPSVAGQSEVIRAAHRAAGIDPATIGYVECHGTATPLGDPIELAALTAAFDTGAAASCAIGSLKTNLGHLNHAAGVAGFIKTVFALQDRVLPPSLHYHEPNPEIDFAHSPFYVNERLCVWDGPLPLRAGVSSFGIGGTNAHTVLEQAPRAERTSLQSGGTQLLPLAARTPSALDALTGKLHDHLASHPELNIADVAYTLQSRCGRFPFRRAVICEDPGAAVDALAGRKQNRCWTSTATDTRRTIVYLLPGQGSQYSRMGHGLYESIPVFREAVDACLESLAGPVKDELAAVFRGPDTLAAGAIDETRLAQPALFVCEFACAQLLKTLGPQPALLLGHSLGELVAACLAGVFTLEEALKLVVLRGELMQSLPPGAMLAIDLTPERAGELLEADISLAAVNGASRCVLSGPTAAISRVEEKLVKRGTAFRRLRTSRAFHSAMVEPVLEKFTAAVAGCRLQRPSIPFLSNVSGKWIRPDEATAPEYWARQLRSTVQFHAGIELLFAIRNPLALEVGPGNALSSLIRRCGPMPDGLTLVNLMRRADQDRKDGDHLFERLGKLWIAGVELEWSSLHRNARRQRVPLPTYPFDRRRVSLAGDLGHEREKPGQLYLPVWRRKALPAVESEASFSGTRWLLFADIESADSLVEFMREAGAQVVVVLPGDRFRCLQSNRYEINPTARDDYDRLIDALAAAGFDRYRTVHGWSLASTWNSALPVEEFGAIQERGFFSVLRLAQALTVRKSGTAIDLYLLTRDATEASGSASTSPAQAPLLALATVISQETSSIRCRSIDLSSDDLQREGKSNLLCSILAGSSAAGPLCAYRRGEFWESDYVSIDLPAASSTLMPVREEGVYLITGGLGELGMIVAEYLFRTARAKLVLLTHAHGSHLDSRRAGFLERLRAAGASVLTIAADCANKKQMEEALQRAEEHFGVINGVIHAAAVTRTSSISTQVADLRAADCDEQFRTKVHGAIVLRELLRPRRADFVLLMSSLASVLGGFGFGAYAAANRFLDAAAHAWSNESGTRWIAVNWDGWDIPEGGRPKIHSARSRLLTMEEGIDALARILAYNGPAQVLVSATDLATRRRQWISKDEDFAVPEQTQPAPVTSHTGHDAVKQQLAVFFKELFGVSTISFDESFADLGGDSLMALTLASRINGAFALRLQVSDLLEWQTIDRIATEIREIRRSVSLPRLCRAEEQESYPLSFAQQSMLLERNLVYDTRFNCSGAIRMAGLVETERLEQAFRCLIRRHEILRTAFDVDKGRQRVSKEIDFRLDVVDCSAGETAALFQNFVTPFELHQPPLLRARLVRAGDGSSHLLLDMHHAITDGVSINLMIAELWSIYRGESLPEVLIQYRDYALWQDRLLRAGAFENDKEFWLDALRDYVWTELPASEEPDGRAAFSQQIIEVSPAALAGLLAFCKQQRLTLMTLLTAAIYQAIEKTTGQRDLTIGLRVSRRTEAPLETMLGPFVEDVACRMHLSRSSDEDVLSETGRVLAASLDRGGYSYDSLNDQLQLKRPTPNGELFTILVNQLPPIASQLNSSIPTQFSTLPRPLNSKYYLNLRLRPGRGLQLDAKYRSDKYSSVLVEQFLQSIVSSAQSLSRSHTSESINAVASPR